MAFTQITTSNLDNTITTKLAAAEAANAAVANIVSLAISSVQIADSSYNVIDDTAANTGGGYLVINGTGFTNQSVVIVGTTNATSTTFANTKQLRAQVPGLAAASYPLYVVDSVTGATAIKVNGLTYSSFPAWSTGSTLANTAANTAFAVSLSANSDSSITYANTTALPDGTTLAANGYFSGTVTIGAQTTYSFDVKATDAENQDVSRTFSLTVTVTPPSALYVLGGYFSITGQNDGVSRSSPTQVGENNVWSKIAFGQNALALKTDGTLWAWGPFSSGSIGLNNATAKSSPTQVGTDTNWAHVFAGSNAQPNAAVKTNGTFWVMGENTYGQLGLNNTIRRSSPTQVGSGTNWPTTEFKIATMNQGGMAVIKTDGTLWSWGENVYGSLGINNTLYRSSPVQVGTDTSWSTISSGTRAAIAVKTDGTLWAWGYNFSGQLGLDNNPGNKSSPVQVGAGTNWLQATGTFYANYAVKTNGTLWAWGSNSNGELGINNIITRSSPTQVGTGTDWNRVYSMNNGAMATKTNGTLWAWGLQGSGELGLNDRVSRSSPVQVGTSATWSSVTQGGSAAFAILTN